MALNIDYIIILGKIFDKNTFDEELFDEFINTAGVRGFIEHENIMGRKVDHIDIEDELRKAVKNNNYKDKYEFYRIKRNLKQLKKDIEFFKDINGLAVKLALERVYRIIPEEIKIKNNIYLYVGGVDGGFTVNRKDIFINYVNYIGQKKEFIKILSHELYHSRDITLINKIKLSIKNMSSEKRYLYGILGKAIEEGIACLIQHGAILEKDDLTGNLTRRNLFLTNEQFDILNDILMDIKFGKYSNKKINELNTYSIGYIIVSTVYNEKGPSILNDWTINLEFRRIIKAYIELCNRNKNLPSFKYEAIEWIIK